MRKLFLLEDDLSLISGLTFAFKKQGFALDTARTLAEAEGLWSDRKYDLLVLDVSLPDGSGFDFCQKVRRTSNVPILFLTASDEEMNIMPSADYVIQDKEHLMVMAHNDVAARLLDTRKKHRK